jgi:large subunit ribosomal protein L25
MDMVEIAIERRTSRRKGAARKARRTGVIPAVFYGPKRSTVSVTVKSEEFDKKLAHLEGSHLIRLLNAGQDPDLHDKAVLLREVQVHPVSGAVLHADFFEVDLTERLTVSVALHFVGKAAGVTDGGILQPIQREIEVECLPTEIPQYIEVDVSPLGIHEAVHLGEVKLPEGVTAVGDPSQALVTVLPPTVEEAKPTEAAEAVPVEGAAPEGAAAPAAGEAAPAEGKGKKGGGEG